MNCLTPKPTKSTPKWGDDICITDMQVREFRPEKKSTYYHTQQTRLNSPEEERLEFKGCQD